jgi:signal transduction histidine kinase
MRSIWSRISEIGIREGLSADDTRSVIFINRILAILVFFSFSSIIINIIQRSGDFIPVLSAYFIVLVFSYFLQFWGYFNGARILILSATIGLLLYMTIRAGEGAGLEFYFLSLLVLPVIIFSNNVTIYFFQALCIIALIAQKVYFDYFHPHLGGVLIYKVFYIVNGTYSGLLIILAIFFFKKISLKNEDEISNANKVIGDKNNELSFVNKQLESFTYSVSHDLRSPLRSIDGFSKILLKDYSDKLDDEGKELLQFIVKDASKMKQLIDDLLAYSRAGMQEIRIAPIDMNRMAREIIEELHERIGDKTIDFEIRHLIPAKGDRILIKQVWFNLLSNAVKYTSKTEGPKIEVGSYIKEHEIIYYVKDNGAGFDMDYALKLFNVFQRLHSEQEFEGTGVGLAIVKNSIARHGGHVWAEGQTGKGATFYFTLPEENVKE